MIKTILKLLDGTEISAGKNEVNAIQNTSITESCNDGEDLSFGSVCAKKIEVKIITPQNKLPINAGDKITVYEEENGIRRKKGHFIAEKPQKKGANTTNIVAYDNISLLDKDITEWFNALDGFPYTSYNMAKMVCEHCGIGLANSTITNGDFLINKTELDSVTARQIIRWIGEICGCFCIADENGNAFYRWYEENTIPIVANRLENGVIFLNGGLSYEDYEVKRIDRVEIIQDSKKNVVSYPVWVGEGNVYVIKSNPFMETDSIGALEIAEGLYQILEKISYIPCKVSVPASFGFNVGDIVKIKDANGIEFFSYIMEKTRNGQKETLESSGNYERNGATTLYNTSYSATYGKNLKIQKDIAKINLEASENAAGITALTSRVTETEENIGYLEISVAGQRSELEAIAKWQDDTDASLASLEATATENEAKIGLVVETSESGKDSVKGSVLVEAINGQSTATISANKVNLNGYVTVNSLKADGTTVIDGSRVQTGQIVSKNFSDDYIIIVDNIMNVEFINDTVNENPYSYEFWSGDVADFLGYDNSTYLNFSLSSEFVRGEIRLYKNLDIKVLGRGTTVSEETKAVEGRGRNHFLVDLHSLSSNIGTLINLESGIIQSQYFGVGSLGAYFCGKVEADVGSKIAKWEFGGNDGTEMSTSSTYYDEDDGITNNWSVSIDNHYLYYDYSYEINSKTEKFNTALNSMSLTAVADVGETYECRFGYSGMNLKTTFGVYKNENGIYVNGVRFAEITNDLTGKAYNIVVDEETMTVKVIPIS